MSDKKELKIYKWTNKSKYTCPSCEKKKVDSSGDCKGCGAEYQLKMDMKF